MLSDEGYIIENMFRIANKEGVDMPFLLNTAQATLDMDFAGRGLVPKARQEGISSYVLARFTASCMKQRNVKAVVISHDQESTQRMLNKVKYYIKEIRGPKPVIQNMSANLISFPKNNSAFYIGTAGSRKFGRGDTISHLHCSEYAFWPNPAELIRGLFQAVPLKTGEIFIESTGNGFNDYYNRCMRAYKEEGTFGLHFFPWHDFPEYTMDIDEEEAVRVMQNLDPDMEEDKVSGILTPGQILWRRIKLDEMDYDLRSFKQEYPMTLEECFQATGQSIFHKVNYLHDSRWEKYAKGAFMLEGHPVDGYTYVFGCDISAGVGKDSSVIQCICLDTMEQVFEYSTDRTDPEQFAQHIVDYAPLFGNPYVVVENNNHGILTLAVLDHIYPSHLIHTTPGTQARDDEKQLFHLGYRTSTRTKPLMIGRLRSILTKELKIYSPMLRAELSTFVEHEDGRLAAQDGCHDDLVMAMGCAVIGIGNAGLITGKGVGASSRSKRRGLDPFSGQAIIEQLRKGRGGKLPIRPQTFPSFV